MKRGETGSALNLAPVMAILQTLLGEHEAPILVDEVRGSAWESELPWRQTRGGFRLRMPISQLAQPRIVDQIARHAVTSPIYCVERGRGDARRVVWMLSHGELTIDTRHIHLNDHELVQGLAEAFFNLGDESTVVDGGFGELIDHSTFDSPPRWAGWSLESWLAKAVQNEAADDDSLLLAGPKWITLLTHRHLNRMGGIARVETSAAQVERVCAKLRRAPGWNNFPGPFLKTARVRHGLLVTIAPVHYVLAEGCLDTQFGWGHDDALAGARWLTHELHRSGLLALPSNDWLERLEAQVDRRVRESEEREAEQRRRATDCATEQELAPMHAPRCIQGIGKPETSRTSTGGHGGATATFRIYKGDLSGDDGLAIYGRTGEEPGALESPILVGAMKPERAALFFDQRIHGWDGEFAPQGPAKSRPLGRLTQLVCPECQGRLFHAWASFERNEEPVDMTELGKGRTADDLFTWFSLAAACAACGWAATVADIECA